MRNTLFLRGEAFDYANIVAENLGITRFTLLNWTKHQIVPPPIRVNKRLYWSRSALEDRLRQTRPSK